MLREDFLQNLKTIEKGLRESTTFDIAQKSLDKGTLAQVCAEIFKLCIQGAVSLEELTLKREESSLNLEKMRSDIELSILNAKASIANAEAEATKSLIQGVVMIRSVADNAIINQANAAVGHLNTVTQGDIKGHENTSNACLTIIKNINTKPITTFDDKLKALIDRDKSSYGTKNIIIHAPKTLLSVGEFIELKGISTFGEKKTKWTINDELVASGTKNYLFEAKNLGEFKIAFSVSNDKDELEKDEIIIKVIEGELNKEKPFLKKV